MKCRKCKKLVPLEAEACPWCHTRVEEAPAAQPVTLVNKSDQTSESTPSPAKGEVTEPKSAEPLGVLARSAWYFKFEYLVICPKHSRFGIRSSVKINAVFCPVCGNLCTIELVLRVS